MNKVAKTIGVDARFYGPVGKGLGRYTQEIVDNLIKIDTDHNYVIFLSRHNFDSFVCDGSRIKKVLADVTWYSWAEQFVLPKLIRQHQIDLMHFPHFNVPIFCSVKYIVTIHDLILTKYPTVRASTLSPLLYYIKNLAYRLVIWTAVRRSQRIITVSQFTKADIVKNFKINPDKISVTYEGVASLTKTQPDASESDDYLSRYQINRPYLLYVGNAYPHKNLERLILVFKDLVKTDDLQLVLVGKLDYFYRRLVELAQQNGLRAKLAKKVIFTGFVTDAELEVLYQRALVYVFPSLYEGFGLPPLEAMSRSCPVVSSDRASLPEILGPAALYFNPESTSEMLRQIKQLCNDEVLRQNLITAGQRHIKRYDWHETALATYRVYQSVL